MTLPASKSPAHHSSCLGPGAAVSYEPFICSQRAIPRQGRVRGRAVVRDPDSQGTTGKEAFVTDCDSWLCVLSLGNKAAGNKALSAAQCTEFILQSATWRDGGIPSVDQALRGALQQQCQRRGGAKPSLRGRSPKKALLASERKSLCSTTCSFLFCLLPGPAFVDKIQSH